MDATKHPRLPLGMIKRSQGAPGLKSPPMMLKGAWPYLTDEFVEYLNENGMMQKGQPTDRSRPETVMAYRNPLIDVACRSWIFYLFFLGRRPKQEYEVG
ncbi:hypothetical protein NC653_025740 [Populus alba x Populus x berolinensis]|nr:hypothetical protein NC653_025740 [Populus alba x Populus x berolinensis]